MGLVSISDRGEIHALVGENGAGKSTLMKILGGVYPHPQYGGEILIDGKVQQFSGVRDAEKANIAVIYQELSLVQEMTVGENIFLGREPRKFGVIRLGGTLPPRATACSTICILQLIRTLPFAISASVNSNSSKLPRRFRKTLESSCWTNRPRH